MNYQLAQINIAKMKGLTIDDPVMKEFKDNLEHINILAESSEGFIWRLKDDTNNATSFNPYNDTQVIINISVWNNVKALKQFTYQSLHANFVKRRKEWFQKYAKAYYALWWINEGEFPSIEESVGKLEELQTQGPSQNVFNFQHCFEQP